MINNTKKTGKIAKEDYCPPSPTLNINYIHAYFIIGIMKNFIKE